MKFQDKLKIIGLMSGTSCDGLDIALIEICGSSTNTKYELLAGKTIPYNLSQKNVIKNVIDSDKIDLKYISQFNFYLAKIWSDMINSFLKEYNYSATQIDLIGSHGQTIWHQPKSELFNSQVFRSTLQMGDPSAIAQLTQISVVGDFRVADVTLNGQGAPLIPYFDWIIFSQFKRNILSVNIGGISNFTFIPKDGDIEKVVAFDCGPGNILIDGAMKLLFNKEFDKDGVIASKGNKSEKLFEYIRTSDNFIAQKPPKSSGREHYSNQFLQNLMKFSLNQNIDEYDIIHTLTYYSVYAIFENYQLFIDNHVSLDEIIISGGGAHNNFLVNKLINYFPNISVKQITEFGIDIDLKEAIGFAILANETIKGNPSNIPQVTGADSLAILGKICLV